MRRRVEEAGAGDGGVAPCGVGKVAAGFARRRATRSAPIQIGSAGGARGEGSTVTAIRCGGVDEGGGVVAPIWIVGERGRRGDEWGGNR